MNESRGTGLTPGKLPKEWEKRPVDITYSDSASPGAMVTSRPTARALAPLPGDVNTVLNQSGSFIGGLIGSRPGMQVGTPTPLTNSAIGGTEDDNVASQGFGAVDLDHHTGKPTIGSTSGKGSF